MSKYSAKYNYVYDDVFLIAEINPNSGQQWLIMRKVDPRTLRVLIEDRIQCIHTGITTITPEDFEDKVADEDFEEDMLNIRSSERAHEIHLEINEKFFAFKSWVQGIAEAGVNSITIQSDIEQYSHLMNPIANRLFNFLLRAKTDFIMAFLFQMERDCRLDGEYHKPSINANLMKLLDIMILEEREAWNIWRDQVKTNYTWYDEWNLYLINPFDDLIQAAFDLDPSAQIFLEKDKFHFVLKLPAAKNLSDWEKTVKHTVCYQNKFISTYKSEETGLICLDLSAKKIPAINAIEGWERVLHIEELHFGNNWIEKIEGLEILVQLKYLNLGWNYIKKIEGLEKLQNLELLYLGENPIEKIEGLDRLVNLKELYLFGNKITSIEGLDNLSNLRKLTMSSNHIKEISGLKKLTSLKTLNLGLNQIEEVSGLEMLVNLEVLELFNNQLKEEPDLSYLPNLRVLRLESNPFNKK